MIPRELSSRIKNDLFKGKVILLYGARQVGKTTLVHTILKETGLEYTWLNGDEPDIRRRLAEISSTELKALYGGKKLIVFDEAQRIENIGLCLKLSVDRFPETQIIATGSSALELANQIKEALTGRKFEHHLYPFSFHELKNHHGEVDEMRFLEHRLIYGSYPDVITHPGEERRRLMEISDSYLFKDLFAYEGVRKTSLFQKILSALALQLGQEVSYNELSNMVGAGKETVERYIDLLEQTFVIFRLNAFSGNVRNELRKSKKIYFHDNGIRNAILNNFLSIGSRSDTGALWENYLISERIKMLHYRQQYKRTYFWRSTQQQEVDYLEEADQSIDAFEFKWSEKRNPRFPKTFLKNYPVRHTQVIHQHNYPEFIDPV